jgi:WD40 repeat protein
MRRLAGPRAPITSLAVCPDGRWLAAAFYAGGSHPNNVCLWDLHDGGATPALKLAGQALTAVFAPDAGSIAVAGSWEPLRRYALPGLEPLPLRTPFMRAGVSFTPDSGALLAIGAAEAGGNSLYRFPLATGGRTTAKPLFLELQRPVPARFVPAWPDLSPDGTTFATVARPTEAPRSGLLVCLWDVARQRLAAKFSTRRNRCESLHFSPDGRRLAAVCNHQVLVFDATTRKRLAVLDPPADAADAFALGSAFTPDGRQLLVGFGDRVRTFDTDTWAARETYDWGVGPVLRLTVTPDGLCAFAAGHLGEVVVWDLEG